jgi:hypothetical protein
MTRVGKLEVLVGAFQIIASIRISQGKFWRINLTKVHTIMDNSNVTSRWKQPVILDKELIPGWVFHAMNLNPYL